MSNLKILFSFVLCYVFQHVVCQRELCSTNSIKDRSCSTQILGSHKPDHQTCRVEFYPPDSSECKDMVFGPITENKNMGEVKLEPYAWNYKHNATVYSNFNPVYTVLNITFTNIKWKTMKFRFQRYGYWNSLNNHCRNIVISSNITVDDQSVLYYDCLWSKHYSSYDGQKYILDFEAVGDKGIKRGQYYFNIPSSMMLSPFVKLHDWEPFIYIEIRTTILKLHILPSPPSLLIKNYQVEVIKMCEKCTQVEEVVSNKTVNSTNGEITHEYSFFRKSGSYYFIVTPLHEDCPNRECKSVRSPTITISNDAPVTVICIASITSLVVAILFAYYVALRLIRRYWCKDYKLTSDHELLSPPKILVVYSPTNKLHAECVKSFVNYLRYECGLDVMYDCDIASTSHGDPFVWCEETFKLSNYIVNVVSPAEETNFHNNIYEPSAITAHRNIDKLLLNLVKVSRAAKSNKHIVNVVFEHSKGPIPIETQNARTFYLLKDWQKLTGFLSKNLLPQQQIMRTEKGRCLLEDLMRAKKLLSQKTVNNVLLECETMGIITDAPLVEKKVLLKI